MDYKKASGKYLPLTEQLLQRAEDLDYIKSFWIHGSRAAGTNTEKSDVDYAFVVENKADEEGLAKNLEDIFQWRERVGFYPEQMWLGPHWKEHLDEEGFRGVGMHFYSRQEIKDKFWNLFDNTSVEPQASAGLDRWQNTKFLVNQGGAQFIIVESIPLYDPEDILKKAREKVLNYPDEFAQKLVDQMVWNLEIKLGWFGEPWIPRGRYNFISDIREVLYYVAIAHYAKNKALMQNGLKRYYYDIENLKPNIKGEVDNLLRIDENFESEDKSEYLKSIIKKLAE